MVFAEVTGRGGTKYRYFVCRGREDGVCDLPHLRVELVEEAIAAHYETLALPSDFITALRSLLDEVLADESASVRERHASLQRQLKKLDQKEDRLVTALADDTMPTGKIKAKLQDIRVQRLRIEAGLTDSAAELSLGVDLLRDALRLVSNPRQLYQDGTDSIRRLLNETFFERFYLDDPDVADDEKTPLFSELHDAHRAYRERSTGAAEGLKLAAGRAGHQPGTQSKRSTRRRRPSGTDDGNTRLNDQAVEEKNAPTLASVFSVTGSGKGALVGLTGFEPATT
ncbi:zinc ribbon domain-containing protein [Nocardia mexicana]|uniref:zinc ribbon domain-containing protein n=1 Tax=Nocardia mexicana TaxID=279262 RepID=UPI000E0BF0DD|nr:zinc ribbon domain-containing protein [Nocardia mexicana]